MCFNVLHRKHLKYAIHTNCLQIAVKTFVKVDFYSLNINESGEISKWNACFFLLIFSGENRFSQISIHFFLMCKSVHIE